MLEPSVFELFARGCSIDRQAELKLACCAELSCQRAALKDGQSVLELGCGWGSMSLYMAARYPNSNIVAVSNSKTQKELIDRRARERGLANLVCPHPPFCIGINCAVCCPYIAYAALKRLPGRVCARTQAPCALCHRPCSWRAPSGVKAVTKHVHARQGGCTEANAFETLLGSLHSTQAPGCINMHHAFCQCRRSSPQMWCILTPSSALTAWYP